jgi:hypothetical protein
VLEVLKGNNDSYILYKGTESTDVGVDINGNKQSFDSDVFSCMELPRMHAKLSKNLLQPVKYFTRSERDCLYEIHMRDAIFKTGGLFAIDPFSLFYSPTFIVPPLSFTLHNVNRKILEIYFEFITLFLSESHEGEALWKLIIGPFIERIYNYKISLPHKLHLPHLFYELKRITGIQFIESDKYPFAGFLFSFCEFSFIIKE